MQNLDQTFLAHALLLAEKRRGFCAPNPSVGAVLVRDQKIIGEGFHFAAGHPHAEVMALQNLSKEELKNTTLYVTLEPCCMHGRTPPCTDLIIQKGISRVIYAFQDPDPRVAGKGEAQLKTAGIDCKQIECKEIDDFYRSYAYWQKTKLPWVTAKIAVSKDQKIAGPNKSRVAISGKHANDFTQLRRKKSDAILTTAETILIDHPSLNARLENEVIPKPIFILDRQLRVPHSEKIFETAEKIAVFYDAEKLLPTAYPEKKITHLPIPKTASGHLNLSAALKEIGKQGVQDLWIEAGAVLLETLLKENLINELFLYRSKNKMIQDGYALTLPETIFFEKTLKMIDTDEDEIYCLSLMAQG